MNDTLLLWITLLLFVLLIGYTFIWREKKRIENATYIKTPQRKVFEKLSWIREQINTQPWLQSRKDFEEAKQEIASITDMRIRNIFEQDINEIAEYLAIRSEKQNIQFPISIKGTIYATLARVNESSLAKDKELAIKYYTQARSLFPKLSLKEQQDTQEIMLRIRNKIEQE